jgi:hypothetical protein
MKLNRNHLYFIGIGMIVLYMVVNKLYFLARGSFADGEVISVKTISSSGRYGSGYSKYPVVKFQTDDYEVTFTGEENLDYVIGDKVSVVYLSSDIEKAKVYSWGGFWMPGLFMGFFPFLILSAAMYSFFGKNDVIVVHFGRFWPWRKE